MRDERYSLNLSLSTDPAVSIVCPNWGGPKRANAAHAALIRPLDPIPYKH